MPFTFKLSKRLALMKAWLLLAAAAALAGLPLLVACELVPHPTGPISGAVVQIVVRPDSVALDPQQTQPFRAFGRTAAGDSVPTTVLWSTSGGTITQSGFYTAGQAVGNFHVTAKQNGGSLTDSSAVSVIAMPVASVTVSPASASVGVGQTLQLTATPQDASGNPLTGRVVTWVSSAPLLATVSGSGLVSGVAAGPAMITATSEGQSGTATVTVTALAPPPVASVTVSPATVSVRVGATVQLAATPKDASGNPLSGRGVTWASSNTAVATVNGSGLVSGVAAGPATITATREGEGK